jgi:hypothetical protein
MKRGTGLTREDIVKECLRRSCILEQSKHVKAGPEALSMLTGMVAWGKSSDLVVHPQLDKLKQAMGKRFFRP